MSSSYKDINFTDRQFTPAKTVDGQEPRRRRRVGDRQQTAHRLLFEVSEFSYDPDLDIDWDAPLDADGYWLAPEKVSLFGSPEWRRLSTAQQRELARHELVSIISFITDAQGMLCMLKFRDVMEAPCMADDVTRFLLLSARTESRNATMMGRLANKTGLELYKFSPAVQRLARNIMLIPHGPMGRAFELLLQEVIDQLSRELAADQRGQRVVQQVGKIQAILGRRSVEFAEGELDRAVEARRYLPPALADVGLALLCVLVSRVIVNSQVYSQVGLTPRAGRRAARRSVGGRRTKVLLRRYFEEAQEAGMFGSRASKAILRAGGLVDSGQLA